MMDHRIRLAGYRLWSDGSAVMWHRRRGVKRVRMQIRNYGLVRTLAGRRYPELWGFSHSMVSSFPILVIMSAISFIWGCSNGGLAWPEFWDISTDSVPMGVERAMVHQFPTLVALFNIIAWIGAALGPSPSKSATTVFLSPIISFILLWDYGVGINKARVALAMEVHLHRLMTEHATRMLSFLYHSSRFNFPFWLFRPPKQREVKRPKKIPPIVRLSQPSRIYPSLAL